MKERAQLLERLVQGQEPAEPLMEALAKLGWDWDEEPLLVLQAQHIESMLERFLNGEITAAALADWADRLEVRDDVGLDPKREETLKDLLFRIANPELNGPLTKDTAEAMRAELHGS